MTQEGRYEGARRLLRGCRHGSLATLDASGAPFATLVAVASEPRGHVLMLLSELARHTANLARDGRASLLLDGSPGRREPLAAPRLTLTGTVKRLASGADAAERRRYLAHHPEAAMLLDLGDFHVHRFDVAAGHLVEGFGRIGGLVADAILVEAALAAVLAATEAGAIDHMHDDHADALDLLGGGTGTRLTALDADGLVLVRDGTVQRADFVHRLDSADQLRAAIVELVRKARKS